MGKESLLLIVMVTLLYFLHLPETCLACTCSYTVSQAQYCNSETVIRLKVISGPEVLYRKSGGGYRNASFGEIEDSGGHQANMYRRYKYESKKVFKGDAPETGYLYSPFLSNLCGQTLDNVLPEDYLLMVGSTVVRGGEDVLDFDLCQHVKMWKNVHLRVKLRLKRGKYDKLCDDCEIAACQDIPWSCSPLDDFCALDENADDAECYETSACKRNKKGVCVWKRTKAWKNCVRDAK